MIHCLVPDLPKAHELAPWLARIDENRWYTNFGPLVREFEQRLAAFMQGEGRVSCVSVASGMNALELGLRALGVGPGKRVLMPALTFAATALAVTRVGAVPVFADVDAETWTLTPAVARAAIAGGRIDLVMPVATYGLALPAAEWDAFVMETRVPVFADAAAALGVQVPGRRVHWAFSLHATKPMGIGEGGLFVTPEPNLADRVRRLSNFGFDARVIAVEGGTNAKLSEYAAAIGLAQLQRWPQLLHRRQALLQDYRRLLAEWPDVKLQSDSGSPPATLSVQLPDDAGVVAKALAQQGVETRRWYLPPLYEHPAFRQFRGADSGGQEALPVTKLLAGRLLGLPFHTRVSTEDVTRVVQILTQQLGPAGKRRSNAGRIAT